MPLTYGLPTNYQSPLRALPSRSSVDPVEGRLAVPCEVLWTSMGGTGKVIGFNLKGDNAPADFSAIRTLRVDNADCTVPVQFIFPDLGERITIPANAKLAIVPVLSNLLEFIVSAPTAIVTDVTRFELLNYGIPPLYIP